MGRSLACLHPAASMVKKGDAAKSRTAKAGSLLCIPPSLLEDKARNYAQKCGRQKSFPLLDFPLS
jgi:hypothetical protein